MNAILSMIFCGLLGFAIGGPETSKTGIIVGAVPFVVNWLYLGIGTCIIIAVSAKNAKKNGTKLEDEIKGWAARNARKKF